MLAFGKSLETAVAEINKSFPDNDKKGDDGNTADSETEEDVDDIEKARRCLEGSGPERHTVKTFMDAISSRSRGNPVPPNFALQKAQADAWSHAQRVLEDDESMDLGRRMML